MKVAISLLGVLLLSVRAVPPSPSPLTCDLRDYRPQAGLTAASTEGDLVVTWRGAREQELRARYAIETGQPLLRNLAVRKPGAAWVTLGENLTPEYCVVTGIRRMSTQQADPLRAAGVELTPEVIAKTRGYAFWDAPLFIPPPPGGGRGQSSSRTLGPPRTAAEIRRASASFNSSSC